MAQEPDPSRHDNTSQAVAAALLAILGLVPHGAWIGANVESLYYSGSFGEWLRRTDLMDVLGGAGNLLVVVALGWGAVALLLRRGVGRRLVAAGAAGAIAMVLGEIVHLLIQIAHGEDADTKAFQRMGVAFLCFALPGPILTLGLVLSPGTREWVRRRERATD
ncbi:hypothetical protein GCM10027174_42110 [Salinifilum aidingensis]